MLESVLADILARILGQYLEGIDRESVRFGAWSGLVELRGVALRPEALAVLFETLGMNLPVTVEAGFIGLLRLQVPWKAIGTTPVQILMEDITIIARPVRGDGSDDSELELRERRIKRARLNTDDAVREASWGFTSDTENKDSTSWSTWLVTDELRAKIIDNVQIHLKDTIIRFEDPFSDEHRPYITSIAFKSLKMESANKDWVQAFVVRGDDPKTRKIFEVTDFRVHWAPITPENEEGFSRGTANNAADSAKRFHTPEMLRHFLTRHDSSSSSSKSFVQSLVDPVDCRMTLVLSPNGSHSAESSDIRNLVPAADLDIRFPEVSINLNDAQYTSLLQTSVYFARLATRGVRPKSPRARWVWAIDQMLPGFSTRRARVLRLMEDKIAETRTERLVYEAYRKSFLKARRTGVEEPHDIAQELERIESTKPYEEIIAFRDWVDRQIEVDGEDWRPVAEKLSSGSKTEVSGTTTSTIWKMLGYSDAELEQEESPHTQKEQKDVMQKRIPKGSPVILQAGRTVLSLRVAFLLHGVTLNLGEGGYPHCSTPRLALSLRNLRVGVLFSSALDLIIEAVLGSVCARDIVKNKALVYNRLSLVDIEESSQPNLLGSAYPTDVTEAIESIRNGSNPAKDVLIGEDPYADDDVTIARYQDDTGTWNQTESDTATSYSASSSRARRQRHPGSEERYTKPHTFRVTKEEFLGASEDSLSVQKYAAAFRYSSTAGKQNGESASTPKASLEISIAMLEAIVDGPKGSFVWGLKFWRPRGLAEDPIMAFLGAAAGARIAELRMDIEEALVANHVSLQINAVILAPRFIIPGGEESAPAIVVNMGTLGICTSDTTAGLDTDQPDTVRERERYSNYVMTLDNLGMYFCPVLATAISRFSLDSEYDVTSLDRGGNVISLDTTGVERIIQPFSLRFVLQTLRDGSVVQVALHSDVSDASSQRNIAKVRVRGTVPDVSLVLTQAALQNLLVTADKWRLELIMSSGEKSDLKRKESNDGWPKLSSRRSSAHIPPFSLGRRSSEGQFQSDAMPQDALPTALASYDVQLSLKRVSVELRDRADSRLLTATASRIEGNIIKTGRKSVRAEFSLQSWSVVDNSRGSMAAYRRLIYAGTLSDSESFSPPICLTSAPPTVEQDFQEAEEGRNFIKIRYDLDFRSQKQQVKLRFLSLHILCVRETYIRLARFFGSMRKHVKSVRSSHRKEDPQDVMPKANSPLATAFRRDASHVEDQQVVSSQLTKYHTSIISEFDGFNCQLIASGGAIAIIEMKDCKIQYLNEGRGSSNAWGECGYFSVRDLTSPIHEHSFVVIYEKLKSAIKEASGVASPAKSKSLRSRDDWMLRIPKSREGKYELEASFESIKVTFLYRFCDIISQYFSVLWAGVQPVVDIVIETRDAAHAHTPMQSSSWLVNSKYKFIVRLELHDFHVRLPRHSACSTEAVEAYLPNIRLFNVSEEDEKQKWICRFSDASFAVQYAVSPSNPVSISSPFVKMFIAEVEVEIFGGENSHAYNSSSSRSMISVHFQARNSLHINLSEAQYTVLYFVLTENLAETITELDLSLGVDVIDRDLESNREHVETREDIELDRSRTPYSILQSPEQISSELFSLTASIPSYTLEISRGWDVSQQPCKVLSVKLRNVKMNVKRFFPRRLAIEVEASLLRLDDLRFDRRRKASEIVIPIYQGTKISSSSEYEREPNTRSLSMSYEKVNTNRPSLVLLLNGLQIDIALDFFNDLSRLAIPGWPFLAASAFAPDYEYVGRTLSVALNNSQFLVRGYQQENCHRTLAAVGEFEVKMEWMRYTGAKLMSLQTRRTEVSCLAHMQPEREEYESDGSKTLFAMSIEATTTPLLYPTGIYIEYVGPAVDDNGCRLNVSADALLCLVTAMEIPVLQAVARELSYKQSSYLSRRKWKQPTVVPGATSVASNPKEEQKQRTRASMNVNVIVSALRCVISDDTEGQFIPVLETRLSSLKLRTHGESMTQVEGEISMDLFNSEKGWWEPALEPWYLSASVSQGSSGARAYVIRSEARGDFNITPTTVTAAMTVANTLSKVTATTASSSRENAQRLLIHDPDAIRRPSVAAFFVRNELGVPINVNLPSTSQRLTIAYGSQVEVGAQSENLVSSGAPGKVMSRETALRCTLTIASYFSKNVSASEVGLYPLNFFATQQSKSNSEADKDLMEPEVSSLHALWEVKMSKGIPICTVRSLHRILNHTKGTLEVMVTIEKSAADATTASNERTIHILETGENFSIPIQDSNKEIYLRPSRQSSIGDSHMFSWSPPLPERKWLREKALESDKEPNRRKETNSAKRASYSSGHILKCKAMSIGDCDYFLKIVPIAASISGPNSLSTSPWLDVALLPPTIIENHLPGPLFFKVIQKVIHVGEHLENLRGDEGLIAAAGRIAPFDEEFLHFSGESLQDTYLSLAYDSCRDLERNKTSISEFGPPVSFSDIKNGKVKAIFLSPESQFDDNGRRAKSFRCSITPDRFRHGKFSISARLWIRNRCDTALEVCGRGSFYSTGDLSMVLRERPPIEEPDEHFCCEGPYLSIRRATENCQRMVDNQAHSSWWTSASSVFEIKKPVIVNLPGRSLVLNVEPSVGVEDDTRIVTIRNLSWIMNTTKSTLQWCQTSALDAHGNCPTRCVSSLEPGKAHAVHWESKSSYKAVHLRLESRSNDWIWSPAVPVNIGFSRELPAKMYRPKTYDQYIARVASKKMDGGSRVLIILEEDRQNPPYRIVNMCRERAVAFAQVDSQEMPWLVRSGKSTRYSWDDPLAPPSKRMLSIRIIEKDDMRDTRDRRGNSSSHAFSQLSIDVIGERVLVLSEGFSPSVVVGITVEGATKIVKFADEAKDGKPLYRQEGPIQTSSSLAIDGAVPIVAWNDIGGNLEGSQLRKEVKPVGDQSDLPHDYPLKEKAQALSGEPLIEMKHSNIAIFLESLGVSVVDIEPSELIYMHAKGILMNFESDIETQSISARIQSFQIDNQLHQTPYPVLLSMQTSSVDLMESKIEKLNVDHGAIVFEVHRKLTDNDILMINSFHATIKRFHLSFEDKLVSKILQFLTDTSIFGDVKLEDKLGNRDEDLKLFRSLLPRASNVPGKMISQRQIGNISSSRRIYVRSLKIADTSLRLTSAGSGAAVAKAAGAGSTVSTLLGLVLNVENCEFQLSGLEVQNIFDSLHHCIELVREYYVTQLGNQRMKLLASNALVGNPAALFDAVGTGAKVFFSESGRAKGSADFIASVGRGSKSLLSHTVGGIMESVSSIPRAVSSGLEKAVGDNAYLAERKRIRMGGGGGRGSSSKNPAQGLATGALSFAHGISSGVTGLIREPVQGAKKGGAGGLLKGIGKAFIGGVAKPVAGVIDLVVEPAAGFSRQMVDDDRGWTVAIPERPPRAFRSHSRRFVRYDRRFAVGVCLFQAVQAYNGLWFDMDLVDWIELSDRKQRSDSDADVWAWSIIRQYSRSMPGSKERSEKSGQGRGLGGRSLTVEGRVEKTRVALLTETDVIVATLDCKLVAWMSLWYDATYEIWSDGKDVVIKGCMGTTNFGNGSNNHGRSNRGMAQLIAAPWDVPYVEHKQRPGVGEHFEERVACGSISASDDLRKHLVILTRGLQEAHDGRVGMWTDSDTEKCQELKIIDTVGNVDIEDGTELLPSDRSMRHSDTWNIASELASGTMSHGENKVMDTKARERDVVTSSAFGEAVGAEEASSEERLVQQLVEIGFPFERAVEALAETGGDMVKAVDILTSK